MSYWFPAGDVGRFGRAGDAANGDSLARMALDKASNAYESKDADEVSSELDMLINFGKKDSLSPTNHTKSHSHDSERLGRADL